MCRCKPYHTTPVKVDYATNAAIRLQAAWRGHLVRRRWCLIKLQSGVHRQQGSRRHAMERSERLHLLLQQLSHGSALYRSRLIATRLQPGV